MDCASCAATVEKRVAALPGVRRAAVNFAAGRLDAEHDPGLSVEEIERAVEGAGYRVARTEGAEVPFFWRTRRAALTGASAALFLIGLALSLAGTSQVPAMGAYAAAMLVGGLPIFRAAVAGLRARQLDMNLLMGAATIGAAGIGEIVMLTGDAEAPARRVAEAVGYTGRGCSRSRRSRRCAAGREARLGGDGRRRRERRAGARGLFRGLRDGRCRDGRSAGDGRRRPHARRPAEAGGSREALAGSRGAHEAECSHLPARQGRVRLARPVRSRGAVGGGPRRDMGTSIAVTLDGLRLFRKGP